MRRIIPAILAALCFLFLLSLMPGTVQGQPPVTPAPLFTVTPLPTPRPALATDVESVLREAQQASQNALRQMEAVSAVLSLVQALAILFTILGVIAALFGVGLFIEYRANISRARELLGQVIDETKQMRVVQEAVKIRFGDMEKLSHEVDVTLADMQADIRDQLQRVFESNARQVKELQDVVNARLQDMDMARKAVEETSHAMQDQIRDGLQRVYERGDRQMKALLEVLNGHLRDFQALRKEADAALQAMQDQIRDQLQKVYEHGDTQMKGLLDSLNARLRDLEAVRTHIEAVSQEMQNRIRDDLQLVYDRGDRQMHELVEAQNASRQSIDLTRREVETLSLEMQNQIRDQLQALQALQDQVRDEIQAANARLGDLQTMRTEIETLGQAMRDQIEVGLKNAFEQVDRLGQALAMAQNTQQQQAVQALALTQIAQQQIAFGNLRAAADSLRRAAAFDSDNRVVHYLLGDVALRLGDLAEGFAHLQKAGAGTGEFPAADAAYAYALRLQGDREEDLAARERLYAEAAESFLKLFEHHPDLLDSSGESPFGALASLYRRQGRPDQALSFYEHVRRVTPQSSYPLNNLGLLNFLQGNREAAREYFEQSREIARQKLAISRSDHWAWFDLITADLALGKEAEDITRSLDFAIGLAPGAEALEKFLYGLDEMQRSPFVPANLEQVIVRIQQEIDDQARSAGPAPNSML